jgi:hypothetical protein
MKLRGFKTCQRDLKRPTIVAALPSKFKTFFFADAFDFSSYLPVFQGRGLLRRISVVHTSDKLTLLGHHHFQYVLHSVVAVQYVSEDDGRRTATLTVLYQCRNSVKRFPGS